MSIATAPQHHFPHSIALAAASAVVVAGGLTAIGVAAFQNDDAVAPTHSKVSTTTHNQQCPDDRCLPPPQRGGSHTSRSVEQPLEGGRVMIGLP